MAGTGSAALRPNPDVGPYFRVPKGLFQNGIARQLGASAVAVYVALCEHANRKGVNVFSVADRSLAADTGIAERTIRDVRTKLSDAGLVSFVREAGHSYTYTLIPVQLAWVPVEDRPRQPKKRRALYAPKPAATDDCGRVGVQQILPYPRQR
jgi:hypothetical protein